MTLESVINELNTQEEDAGGILGLSALRTQLIAEEETLAREICEIRHRQFEGGLNRDLDYELKFDELVRKVIARFEYEKDIRIQLCTVTHNYKSILNKYETLINQNNSEAVSA